MTAAGGGAPPRVPFEYAVLRAVPRVDRGECLNLGVLLYCQAHDLVAARVAVDERRLLALDPRVDVAAVAAAVDAVRAVCAGEPQGGPAAGTSARARFGWLTAPRSTVVQPGPVHGGVTADPRARLDHLFDCLVALPGR